MLNKILKMSSETALDFSRSRFLCGMPTKPGILYSYRKFITTAKMPLGQNIRPVGLSTLASVNDCEYGKSSYCLLKLVTFCSLEPDRIMDISSAEFKLRKAKEPTERLPNPAVPRNLL